MSWSRKKMCQVGFSSSSFFHHHTVNPIFLHRPLLFEATCDFRIQQALRRRRKGARELQDARQEYPRRSVSLYCRYFSQTYRSREWMFIYRITIQPNSMFVLLQPCRKENKELEVVFITTRSFRGWFPITVVNCGWVFY